jgi:DNA-binding NarL/FixJ family response regulator
MDEVRVLVVADDPLARAGLAALLSGQPECTVTGQVSGDAELTAALDVYRPDVLVWDLGWDPAPALERLADLEDAQFPIVALLPDEAPTLDAWIAGVRGLLLRDAGAESLIAGLLAVAQGLIVLDPALATDLLPVDEQPPDLAPLVEELTPREMEVLQLLAEGLPNKSIAHHLDISEHTVKFHVNGIMGKLGAQSRTEAVVRATRLGLILL